MSTYARIRYTSKLKGGISQKKFLNNIREEKMKSQILKFTIDELKKLIKILEEKEINFDNSWVNKINNRISKEKSCEALELLREFRDTYIINNDNEKYISQINDVENSIKIQLEDNEHIYFEHIFNLLENLKENINVNTFDSMLKEISDEATTIFIKLDTVYNYLEIIKRDGFVIDEFKFDKSNKEFYVYASKNGKCFDANIKNENIVYRFNNYTGDECLKDLNKVVKIANEYYNSSFEIEEYDGKPIEKHIETVNKKIYDSK